MKLKYKILFVILPILILIIMYTAVFSALIVRSASENLVTNYYTSKANEYKKFIISNWESMNTNWGPNAENNNTPNTLAQQQLFKNEAQKLLDNSSITEYTANTGTLKQYGFLNRKFLKMYASAYNKTQKKLNKRIRTKKTGAQICVPKFRADYIPDALIVFQDSKLYSIAYKTTAQANCSKKFTDTQLEKLYAQIANNQDQLWFEDKIRIQKIKFKALYFKTTIDKNYEVIMTIPKKSLAYPIYNFYFIILVISLLLIVIVILLLLNFCNTLSKPLANVTSVLSIISETLKNNQNTRLSPDSVSFSNNLATSNAEINNFMKDDAFQKSDVQEINQLTEGIQKFINNLAEYSVTLEVEKNVSNTIKNIASRYVPKKIIAETINTTSRNLPNIKQHIAMLFSDIRGFTHITNNYSDPNLLAKELNEYLNIIAKCIKINGGIIDKVIGDGVVAMFGPLTTLENSALAALKATLEANFIIEQINKTRENNKLDKFITSFGLHYGEVTVGTFGSEENMDYTALGTPINYCSSLEQTTKIFSNSTNNIIWLSQQFVDQLPKALATPSMASAHAHTGFMPNKHKQYIIKSNNTKIEMSKAIGEVKLHIPDSKGNEAHLLNATIINLYLGKVTLQGTDKSQIVYSPFVIYNALTEKIYDQLEIAISDFFKGKYEIAKDKFYKIIQKLPTCHIARLYHRRCKYRLL